MQIVKICKVHGELTIDQTLISKTRIYKSYRCKECRRAQQVKHKRGISDELYNQLKESQNGKCAICSQESTLIGRSKEVAPLYVDHCHKCISHKHFRELLCSSCNTGIGYAKDDILLLQKSIDYLSDNKY